MAFSPINMTDVDLTIGDEATPANFKCQIRSVELAPETNIIRTKTACPGGQFSASDTPEWTLNIGHVYGRDTADVEAELAGYLFAHQGEKQPFVFRPIADGEGWAGVVTIIAAAVGGDINAFNDKTVALPLEGQPTRVAAI